ncbi:MAG: hypothetical protein OQK12_15035 [Motiliproteus sp.]|nr:hypothetical protein [Motiliproteus sp.]MCW9052374.1 hypothetical protein [Motiliproteus sp.]
MLHSLSRKSATASLSMLLLVCLLKIQSANASPEVAPQVIVHPSVSVENLSRSTLRSIFTLRLTRWQDGSPVRVFVLPDNNPVHQLFSKRALGVFPYRLRQIWDRMIFSGIGKVPKQIESESAMLKAIAQTPGAIGYVADGIGSSGVKYVDVE